MYCASRQEPGLSVLRTLGRAPPSFHLASMARLTSPVESPSCTSSMVPATTREGAFILASPPTPLLPPGPVKRFLRPAVQASAHAPSIATGHQSPLKIL